MMQWFRRLPHVLLLSLSLLHTPAEAYIGPGAGLSLMGSLLSTLGVVFIVIFTILFWPLRYAWNRLRRQLGLRSTAITAQGQEVEHNAGDSEASPGKPAP